MNSAGRIKGIDYSITGPIEKAFDPNTDGWLLTVNGQTHGYLPTQAQAEQMRDELIEQLSQQKKPGTSWGGKRPGAGRPRSKPSIEPTQLAAAMNRGSEVAAAMNRGSEVAAAMNRGSEVAAAINRGSEVAAAMNRGSEVAAAMNRGNEFAAAMNRGNEFAAAANQSNEFAAAMNRSNEFAAAANRSNEFAAAVRGPEIAAHLTQQPEEDYYPEVIRPIESRQERQLDAIINLLENIDTSLQQIAAALTGKQNATDDSTQGTAP